MSATKKVVRVMPAAALLLFLLSSCNWQMFESVQVTGSPEVNVPGGTITGNLNDFLDEIETASGAERPEEDGNRPFEMFVDERVDGELDQLKEGFSADEGWTVDDTAYPLVLEGDDVQSFEFDLPAEMFDFFDEIPEGLDFREDSVILGFDLKGELVDESGDEVTNVDVTVTAEPTGSNGGSSEQSTTTIVPGEENRDDRVVTLDISTLLRDRPDSLRLEISFPPSNGESYVFLKDSDPSPEVTARLNLKFALEATDNINLVQFIEGNEYFETDGDLFERDSSEDLEEELDNFQSASLTFDVLENTTGLGNLEYRIFFGGEGHDMHETEIARGDLLDETTSEIGVDETTFEKMRNTYPLIVKTELILPGDGGNPIPYQLNYHTGEDPAQLRANIRFRIRTNVDMNFELGDDGQEGS